MMSDNQHSSLSMRVYASLQEKILKGEFASGEALVEVKLSEEYGVSRTPVREALHRLELEGLVSIVAGKGAVVNPLSPQDIEDIFTIRTRIEGLAARWAAQKIEPQELLSLRESVELLEFYISRDNHHQLGELDSRFHEIIYEACKSRPLKSTLATFHNYIKRARRVAFDTEGRPAQVLREHADILHAIEGGDADRAEALACQHIINAAENYRNHRKGE